MDGGNVGVIQRRERLRFELESAEPIFVVRGVRREHLDRDGSFQDRIAGAVDLAHAATADERSDFICAELGVGSIFHRCRASVVGALTLAYYQNLRTESDYFRFGPVPGFALRCGRIQPNVIAVLSPSTHILAAIVGSVTIMFPPRSR